jgi:hypothetical protein
VARTAHSPSSSGGTSHSTRPLCRTWKNRSKSCAQIADRRNDILAEVTGTKERRMTPSKHTVELLASYRQAAVGSCTPVTPRPPCDRVAGTSRRITVTARTISHARLFDF